MSEVTTQTGSRRHDLWILFAFIGACLAVAGLGGLMTAAGISTFYPTLHKPSWNPPNQIFGPVWTALYLMMAVAAWRVWRAPGRTGPGPLVLFGIQLFLNLCWSGIFFTLHLLGLATLEIAALWLAIALTTLAFFKLDRIAGLLFLPYLAWVSFASVLTFTLWRMNS
jgi:benzodiazapine receptor